VVVLQVIQEVVEHVCLARTLVTLGKVEYIYKTHVVNVEGMWLVIMVKHVHAEMMHISKPS